MKFIHIADVHLGVTPDAGMPWSETRSRDIWNSFRFMIEQARRQQADLLLIAGDLFSPAAVKAGIKRDCGMVCRNPGYGNRIDRGKP